MPLAPRVPRSWANTYIAITVQRQREECRHAIVYLSCKLARVGNDQLARLFVELMKSSLNTFPNARTFPDKMCHRWKTWTLPSPIPEFATESLLNGRQLGGTS